MARPLSRFTPAGLSAFSDWIRAGAHGGVPADLLSDAAFTTKFGETEVSEGIIFEDRYQFGVFLQEALSPFDKFAISYDRELWSWLAAFFFDQLAPRDSAGVRSLRKEYAYILESRKYFRHLVRMPWYLVETHKEGSRFLLMSMQTSDLAPLSRQSYILDQLAARQSVIASPTLVGAAARLFSDPRTGKPMRGAGAKGRGSPRRLAILANQLSLTFDMRDMPVEKFMKLLPPEFWWKATN